MAGLPLPLPVTPQELQLPEQQQQRQHSHHQPQQGQQYHRPKALGRAAAMCGPQSSSELWCHLLMKGRMSDCVYSLSEVVGTCPVTALTLLTVRNPKTYTCNVQGHSQHTAQQHPYCTLIAAAHRLLVHLLYPAATQSCCAPNANASADTTAADSSDVVTTAGAGCCHHCCHCGSLNTSPACK